MSIPYRHVEKVTINQHPKAPGVRDLTSRDGLLLILPKTASHFDWSNLAHGEFLAQRARARLKTGEANKDWGTELPTPHGTRVLVVYADTEATRFERLSAARDWAMQLLKSGPASVSVYAAPDTDSVAILQSTLLALLAAVCPLPSRKSKPDAAARLQHIDCFGTKKDLKIDELRAQSQGNHLARWLTLLPGNELRPGEFRRLAVKLAKQQGWQTTFYDRDALTRQGAGAFLAVTQASHDHDGGILHLRYRPDVKRGKQPKLALVGKGVCFDTGGVNLKSAKSMFGMHEDMEGSAVALGTLLALSRLKVDFAIDCWLALAENHIGPQAYKPNDVITASNGTSIEIVHTDAEGRMLLADTLALAAQAKPDLIIDYATLTGACVSALSTRYSGLFSNREALLAPMTAAGKASGERVWPFPLDADFDDMLKSDIADIKQCTIESEADHILAARFLKRFVPDACAWIHIDLSAGNHRGGLAHIASDITGFGVGLTLQAVIEGKLLKIAASGATTDSR